MLNLVPSPTTLAKQITASGLIPLGRLAATATTVGAPQSRCLRWPKTAARSDGHGASPRWRRDWSGCISATPTSGPHSATRRRIDRDAERRIKQALKTYADADVSIHAVEQQRDEKAARLVQQIKLARQADQMKIEQQAMAAWPISHAGRTVKEIAELLQLPLMEVRRLLSQAHSGPGSRHATALWVPNWPSKIVTCGIAGRWSSGMIAGRGGTTVYLIFRQLMAWLGLLALRPSLDVERVSRTSARGGSTRMNHD